MKSATLLILASAGFMLFAMLHKRKADLSPQGSGDLSSRLARVLPSTPASVPRSATISIPRATPTKLIATPLPAGPAPAQPGLLASALSALQSKAPIPVPLINHRTWSRSELRIARGLVRDELPEGLVLDCGGWVVQSATNGGVYAGDGRGMNPIYANLVVTHERLQFGRLMTVDHGALRESVYPPEMWVPETYVYGMIVLEGYPAPSPGHGKGLKVVAAPSGSTTWQGKPITTYTASFELVD